jgi:LysR family glycine cleavage system transcriptional activator
MEAFVTVARSGSLAQAASIMNLTVPALSRRIQLLEAHLGVRLFQRVPRGLCLTEAGRKYHEALTPAWDRICEATEAARGRTGQPVFRVTVMPTFAANWLMPRLAHFQTRHRDVTLEFHTSAELEDLQTKPDLACAIRLGKGPWPGLDCEPILPVHAFPVASPDFFRATQMPHTPYDLLRHTLIETHHQPAFWQEWFAAAGIDTEPGDRRGFDNLQVVYEAAAAGMGVALGLDSLVRPYFESGRLIRLLSEPIRLPLHFHLVRRRDAGTSDRNFELFRDWLRAEANAFSLNATCVAGS